MPNTSSAKKALKRSKKQRTFNAVCQKNIKLAEKSGDLSKIYKALDKAAQRGVIKARTAGRRKSRLARALLSSTKGPVA